MRFSKVAAWNAALGAAFQTYALENGASPGVSGYALARSSLVASLAARDRDCNRGCLGHR